MTGELATPEELAARKARAAAEAAPLSPRDALLQEHDDISDDELAAHIAAHKGTAIGEALLALWRRIMGEVRTVERDEPEIAQVVRAAEKAEPVVAEVVKDVVA